MIFYRTDKAVDQSRSCVRLAGFTKKYHSVKQMAYASA